MGRELSNVVHQLVIRGKHRDIMGVHERMRTIVNLLRPHGVKDVKKIRVGSQYDGGYVMLDDFDGIKAAFALGVGDDDDWDAAMAKRGIETLQFDHTVNRAPTNHPKLKFCKMKITAKPEPGSKTIKELVNENTGKGKNPDLIMKIDIEGYEWPCFDEIDVGDLKRFSQILCEFHALYDISKEDRYEIMKRALEKLNKGFFVFHVHASNLGDVNLIGGFALPESIEISLANRDLYTPIENTETFPGPLDAPSRSDRPDIMLGRFEF